ncbi:MAG: HDOD domain-containing protein [Candidatus Nitrospinota bacterium M3_3B_026]
MEEHKKSVLFVDDEPKILDGLRRMLRGMRGKWDMAFAKSGPEALQMLAEEPFDVIVTDMRMPGMDGAQLLDEVSNRYPQIVRIVLSGQSDREMIFKSVGPAHQYLTKPCDADTLKAVVGKACALRDILKEETVKKMVSRIKSLPSIPSLYFELIEEIENPEGSMAAIGGIISKDLGMTAKILQLVNSAFFGLPQRVSSPAQAASLLGLDIIKALVLSTGIFSQFEKTRVPGFSMDELWRHSGAAAVCAKEIAKTEGVDGKTIDDSFMAGMLHDVGILILASNFPEEYGEILKLAEKEDLKLSAAETRVLGTSHAEVGGYLLGLWGLPDVIVEAAFFHHAPGKADPAGFSPLVATHVASSLEGEVSRSRTMRTVGGVDEDFLASIGLAERLPVWREACGTVLRKREENDEN